MSNSTWYSPDDWYAPLQPIEEAAEEQTDYDAYPTKAEGKKRNRTRIWGAVILVTVLLTAGGMTIRGFIKNLSHITTRTESTASDVGEKDIFPEDYNDFFKDYYTVVTDTGSAEKTNVPRTTVTTEYSLQPVEASGEELSLSELYEKCAPSIVGISGYVDGEAGYYWGSGVILSENGLILTNAHIISGCDSVTITLYDDAEYDAKLVGMDSISDLAVLKIDAEGLPAAEFGMSDTLAVGQPVAAIGNPLGSDFRFTLTDGIISGIDRDMTYNGRTMTLIQTNTAINSGNSGGALFNRCGQVIGITNMKMVSYSNDIEGIGFAIPTFTVKTISDKLIHDGAVIRTTIGITCGGIPAAAAEHYGLPEGLYIASVAEEYDAAAKGVQKGDILTAVNGTPVTVTTEVNAIKDQFTVGDTLTLTLWRAGEVFDVDITLKPAA